MFIKISLEAKNKDINKDDEIVLSFNNEMFYVLNNGKFISCIEESKIELNNYIANITLLDNENADSDDKSKMDNLVEKKDGQSQTVDKKILWPELDFKINEHESIQNEDNSYITYDINQDSSILTKLGLLEFKEGV